MASSIFDKNSAQPSRDGKPATPFAESIVLMDDETWIWEIVKSSIQQANVASTKLPGNCDLRHSWSRFQRMPFLILHWENAHRFGGAIIEEILEIDRNFNVGEKVIVITTNPIHEDVVAFSELGIRRVLRPRQRENDIQHIQNELKNQIQEILNPPAKLTLERIWQKLIYAVDKVPENAPESLLGKIEDQIQRLQTTNKTASARDLDLQARLRFKRHNFDQACQLFNRAIELNPNYFRAWNGLILVKRKQNLHQEAYSLMQKLQLHNRNSISRMVAMGETQLAMNDHRKAERYFKNALEKDAWNSGALNGLAEVKFHDNELNDARALLAKSTIAYKYAAKLNLIGIELVNAGRYEAALEHYSKAQYVLPQQEKGPQLLYNIALCYAKWGRKSMAEEFLKLALVKEPNYKKASRLLEQVQKMTETHQPRAQAASSSSKQSVA